MTILLYINKGFHFIHGVAELNVKWKRGDSIDCNYPEKNYLTLFGNYELFFEKRALVNFLPFFGYCDSFLLHMFV